MDRTGYVGASDVAAIIGHSKYKSPFDVYQVKTGGADPFTGNEATFWGKALEESIGLGYAERIHPKLNVDLLFDEQFTHHKLTWARCRPDAMVHDRGGPVLFGCDIKYTGWLDKDFGPEWTDEMPMYHLMQCVWSCFVTEAPAWEMAVLDGTKLKVWRYERDRKLEEVVVNKVAHFWAEHVLKGVPPADERFVEPSELVGWADIDDPIVDVALNKLRFHQERARLAGADAHDAKRLAALAETDMHRALGSTEGIPGVLKRRLSKPRKTISWKQVAEEMGKRSHFGAISTAEYTALIGEHTKLGQAKLSLKMEVADE